MASSQADAGASPLVLSPSARSRISPAPLPFRRQPHLPCSSPLPPAAASPLLLSPSVGSRISPAPLPFRLQPHLPCSSPLSLAALSCSSPLPPAAALSSQKPALTTSVVSPSVFSVFGSRISPVASVVADSSRISI